MTIRILHLITSLDTGGAERMLEKLVTGMDHGRFRNVVVSLKDEGVIGPRLRQAGIAVHALGMRGGIALPGRMLALARLIANMQPDILQTWLYHADLAGTLAHAFSGSRSLLAWNLRCSDMNLADYAASTRLVLRADAVLSRRPAFIITNSEAGKRHHVALGYRPKRWIDIPNGFDMTVFRPQPDAAGALRRELGLPDTARLAGMLARLDPMKDHGTFIAMAEQLAGRESDLHFLLAGRGCTAANAMLAAARQRLGGRLHLLGERQDVPALLAGLDVFLLTSAYGEGFPNVLGEALATGTPCVATDVGDAAAILGDCGIVTKPRDPQALAAAVMQVLARSPEQRAEMQSLARRRAEENFSLPTIVARYEAVYAEAAAARGIR